MFQTILLATVAILAPTASRAADIVSRAERTDLRFSNDKMVPRAERDAEGNVTGLRLDEMQLSQDGVAELGRLEHLRWLVLFRTNFTDDDVVHLRRCKHLEQLNLTNTEVTNGAIDSILNVKRLRSLRLGDVNITPGAVNRLNELNRSRASPRDYLRWGYSQRKKEPE